MANGDIIRCFEEMASLLEIQGADAFRINTYRKAARSIGDLTEDLADIAERGELQKIPGVGKGMAERITEFLADGRIKLHQELLASFPPGLPRLLEIPGLGPKKIQALHGQLDIGSIEELQAAITDGRVAELPGFGAKSCEKILAGIQFLSSSAGRTPLAIAEVIAESIRARVASLPGVRRVEVAGSLRRGCETIGDIDLLCDADDGAAVVKAFTTLPEAKAVQAAGDTKGSILVASPRGGDLQVDLRVVPTVSFGAAWQYFTGSKEHNVRLRELAVRQKLRLNEYGLFDGETSVAGADEASIYERLGLKWMPPECREDRGEIESRGELPGLVTLAAIRADLHMHTTASDGKCEIEEMAAAAKARGYSHIAITDHSRSSVIANGLSIERLLEHAERVRAINRKGQGITLLAGTECDILSDGSLDYPDEVLAALDWVVASIHAAQQQPRDKLTARCLAALENPYVCVLGHPSGRLIGRRDAMDIDWDRVIKTAARTGTALEVNSSWQRLDLKDAHVRQAMDAGCTLSINTDAHAIDQMEQMRLGIITARRGWATTERVLNAWSVDKLVDWVAGKRGGKA